MSTWEGFERQTRITFTTPAPRDAPETKGTRRYFKPHWLEWAVRPDSVYVTAHGPATRSDYRQGETGWAVEGNSYSGAVPEWVPIPTEAIVEAKSAIRRLAAVMESTVDGA